MGQSAASSTFLLLFLLLCTGNANNITRILNKFPEFSTFNHYLTVTHLAEEISRRQTITVCAVDNAEMADLLSKHPSIYTIKNVLSFHVLLDYFGAKKLHQITNGTALSATMFQASGSAPGSSGFVNITDLKGGKVALGADGTGTLDASFVKSVKEIPYNVSVIQVSKILASPQAEAPAPEPSRLNFTAIMSKKGCKVFADLLTGSGVVSEFEGVAEGGLTIFCPTDDAVKHFLPRFNNLTKDGKASLLMFHGIPLYQSMEMLKSNNGDMNTLATDGGKKFSFTVQNQGEVVTLKTPASTAKLTGTLLDEQPVAIYTLDKVLLPKELFKKASSPTPAPAPAPEAAADSPKASMRSSPPAPKGDEPASGPSDDSTADSDPSGSAESALSGALSVAVAAALVLGLMVVN